MMFIILQVHILIGRVKTPQILMRLIIYVQLIDKSTSHVFDKVLLYTDGSETKVGQPYVDGDEIIKINHCGHTFRRRNLLNWFTRRSTCPICRYDIRSHSNTTATTATTTTNTTASFINELSNIISNTMQDVLENSDTSNNIVTAEVEFNSAVPFEFTTNVNNNINQTDSSNNLVPVDDFDDIV